MTKNESIIPRTLAILVDNEPGVLARVIGLFSGRGYNIDSLTVTEVDHDARLSRITIETRGTEHVLMQIQALLARLVPVHEVINISACENIRRDLALVKVVAQGERRVEALRIADLFKADAVDAGLEHFVFELAGAPETIDRFVKLMSQLGLCELSRTGVAAMTRGAHPVEPC